MNKVTLMKKLVLWRKSERRGHSLNASKLKRFKFCLMITIFNYMKCFFMERFYEKLTREVDLSEESSVVQIKESLDFRVD